MKFITRILSVLFVTVFILINPAPAQTKKLSGDLIIFHAGSLAVPMKEVAKAFNQLYPDVKILMESAGSVASARKITDLNRPCDILASADYAVIDNMLIPKYASYNIRFVTNEMCIVYNAKSHYGAQLTPRNWYDMLMRSDVAFGRADPNADPCGYRTVMTLKLAEKYYKKPGLAGRIMGKDQQFMRPKEVDLLSLLESGSLDYIFIYKSVALQHQLKYLILPDQINLKNPAYASNYATATVEINGKKPGEKETLKGEPMIYGVTILKDAPNKEAAVAFLEFLLSKDQGMKIMQQNGQPSVIPMSTQNYNLVPPSLKKYVKAK